MAQFDGLGDSSPLLRTKPLNWPLNFRPGCLQHTPGNVEMQLLGQYTRQLWRRRSLHIAILDNCMSKVFPYVDVLGTFPAADDVVSPFDARGVVLVYRGRLLLRESETVKSALRYKTSQPAIDAE